MAVQAIQQFKNKEKDRAVITTTTTTQGGCNGNITKCWWCG